MTDFDGFPLPTSNYSKLPHCLIDALPLPSPIDAASVGRRTGVNYPGIALPDD